MNTSHIQYISATLSLPRKLKHGCLCKIEEHTFHPVNMFTSELIKDTFRHLVQSCLDEC